MAELGQFLNTTRAKLDNLEYGGEPRPYLGMSQIGHHCSKNLWYGFHWVDPQKHDGKKERIFNAGHLFEPQIVKQLKDCGFEVFRIEDGKEVEHFGNPEEKQEEYIGFAGHSKGHSDGRIRGIPESNEDHLLEIKTAKDSKFKEYQKHGVKKANEIYYGQTQRYMKATGLKWTLFIMINKNDQNLYVERIPYVEAEALDLVRKENLIIMSDCPPYVEYHKTYYKCTYCNHREVCHGEKSPKKNCRTCEFADIEDDGKWSCQKTKKELSVAEQRVGCDKYQLGWGLN